MPDNRIVKRMILTGSEISKMRILGCITIAPFNEAQINPNSYNYRLGPQLGLPQNSDTGDVSFKFIDIPTAGYILEPRKTYLGHTLEMLGSDTFAMSLIGRSSIGRLGLFLQVSANLGHTGSCHQWTLEMVSAMPLRIYPGMIIGQISFWENVGEIGLYDSGYSNFDAPTPSRKMHEAIS